MLTIIKNAQILTPDGWIPCGAISFADGRITSIQDEIDHTTSANVIDAQGSYIVPGFIDMHVHGGGGRDFVEGSDEAFRAIARIHLQHGTTAIYPTLAVAPFEAFQRAIETTERLMNEPDSTIMGLHLEGPYLNPKFGCDKESNPWQGSVNAAKHLPIIEAAYDIARVWALAPERENIMRFVHDVKMKNPAAVFAVAHSEASPQQIEAIMPYGLCIGTHHTNATGDRPMYPECRGVCVDETVNYNREIYAELICDSRGIHVDPYMLRLVRRIKGDDRIILISDAYACDGPVPPGYDDVDDINFDHAGEIAGSKMTLDISCRNMIKHTGASLVDVFKFASYNPSRAVGFLDRGEIAVGQRADLVLVDYKMKVSRVMLKGKWQA